MNKCVQRAKKTCFTLYKLSITLTFMLHIIYTDETFIVEDLAILAKKPGGHYCETYLLIELIN